MTLPEELAGVEDVDLSGSTVLVTGSTSGIGRETALALGRLGASVVVTGRDAERGWSVVDELDRVGADGVYFTADLSSQWQVRELASDVKGTYGELDVLINNAAVLLNETSTTEDGVEETFAVNHVAPFMLTNLLAPELRDGSGRVVNVSSEAHRGVEMESGSMDGGVGGWKAYKMSKLCNVLFTRELAGRLDSVTANCLHPGIVPGSGLYRGMPPYVRAAIWFLAKIPSILTFGFTDSLASGASTPVYLAASPEVSDVTGKYFVGCEERRPSPDSCDEEAQRGLWSRTVELTDLDPENEVVGDYRGL